MDGTQQRDPKCSARRGRSSRQQAARAAQTLPPIRPEDVVDGRLLANDVGGGLCLSNDVFFGRDAVEYLLGRRALDCRQVW